MTQFVFFERAPYRWHINAQGRRVGLCRGGQCLSFVESLEESCPVPVVDTNDALMVTVSCRYSAAGAEGRGGNVEQPAGEALGTGTLRPLGQNNIFTGQAEGGVQATLPNAGKKPDGSLSAAVKEFWEQLTLDDCLKKLHKISIPPEFLRKGIAFFVALGIMVHVLLMACGLIDRIGNWLLDASALGLGRLWRRARRHFGKDASEEFAPEEAAPEKFVQEEDAPQPGALWVDVPLGDGSAPDAPRSARPAPRREGWLTKVRRLFQDF